MKFIFESLKNNVKKIVFNFHNSIDDEKNLCFNKYMFEFTL